MFTFKHLCDLVITLLVLSIYAAIILTTLTLGVVLIHAVTH